MFPYDAAEWKDLFVATAGASAALAGLLVVAITINIDRILAEQGLADRALATLLLLLGTLVVSILGLAPGQSSAALGIELLAVGLFVTAAVVLLTMRLQKPAKPPPLWRSTNYLVALSGTVPFAVAGLSLLLGEGGGLYWALAGIVLAIVGGVLNAWVLLVEILR